MSGALVALFAMKEGRPPVRLGAVDVGDRRRLSHMVWKGARIVVLDVDGFVLIDAGALSQPGVARVVKDEHQRTAGHGNGWLVGDEVFFDRRGTPRGTEGFFVQALLGGEPRLLRPEPTYGEGVARLGDRLWVATQDELLAFEISGPSPCLEVARANLNASLPALQSISEDRLLVFETCEDTDGWAVRVIDIRPRKPKLVAKLFRRLTAIGWRLDGERLRVVLRDKKCRSFVAEVELRPGTPNLLRAPAPLGAALEESSFAATWVGPSDVVVVTDQGLVRWVRVDACFGSALGPCD